MSKSYRKGRREQTDTFTLGLVEMYQPHPDKLARANRFNRRKGKR